MKRSRISVLKTLILAVGAVSLQACFYGGHRYYSQPEPYGYAPAPTYGYAPNYGYAPAYGYTRAPAYGYAPRRDYDHHESNDRDRRVQNNHREVQEHHSGRVASREHGHEHDEH
jgi:hypothetical protein